jgi:uncharacterized paraquat-inducible protein A
MSAPRRYPTPLVERSTNLQAMTPELLEQYKRRHDEKRRCKCNHLLSLHDGESKCTVCRNCPGYRERDEDDFKTTDAAEQPSTRELIEQLGK